MMDYEILTVKEGWVMKVNGKLYAVERKYRNLNRTKLLELFTKKPGEFKPYIPAKNV